LRVTDVCLTVDEAVTVAGLFRALVRACHRGLDRGHDAPPRHEMVRAATRRACRYGLEGTLIDLVRGEEVPAPAMVRRLLTYVRDACEADEWDLMNDRVAATLARGNGAQRQRRALLASGSLQGVTKRIIEETTSGFEATDDASTTTGASA